MHERAEARPSRAPRAFEVGAFDSNRLEPLELCSLCELGDRGHDQTQRASARDRNAPSGLPLGVRAQAPVGAGARLSEQLCFGPPVIGELPLERCYGLMLFGTRSA